MNLWGLHFIGFARWWLWWGFPCLAKFSPVEKTRVALSTLALSAVPSEHRARQLLVDVSAIAKNDAGTGIQRVVRELLRELLVNPPRGFSVQPVREDRWLGYRYETQYRTMLLGTGPGGGLVGRVQVEAGDIFLGIDLAAHALPRQFCQFIRWKAAGVKLYFLIYDLLPVLRPDWFNDRTVAAYRRWIRTVVTLADGVACISRSVLDDLRNWLILSYGNKLCEALPTTWFHLGGDIPPPNAVVIRKAVPHQWSHINSGPSVLMVGTIEPRKGYAQVLAAFENIWKRGLNINLVIVGNIGWKVESLVKKLSNHPEAGKRLFWFQNASDSVLSACYRDTDGLLMASEGEGFGLPIVEAAKNGKPVLVRDIPVFREIAGKRAEYFSGHGAEDLAVTIDRWVAKIGAGNAICSRCAEFLTWRESAKHLLQKLGIEQDVP